MTGTNDIHRGRDTLYALIQALLFGLVVKPLVRVVIGVTVRDAGRLPREGPAILVANHNSHLDTLVMMSLYPLRRLRAVRPMAAGDYFFRTPLSAWAARHLLGALPVARSGRKGRGHPFAEAGEALVRGEILILFPEGTRGEPERRSALRSGVAHLARRYPEVPVVPLFMHGLGKALPRGEWLPVPFFCDIAVGEPLRWGGERGAYMAALEEAMTGLEGRALEGRAVW